LIGDVRDKDRLARAMDGIDFVVHAAATKIVPTAEYNPFECVKTNINGAMNLIDVCIDRGIKELLLYQQIRPVIQLIFMVQLSLPLTSSLWRAMLTLAPITPALQSCVTVMSWGLVVRSFLSSCPKQDRKAANY
jgi:hypothetical protein